MAPAAILLESVDFQIEPTTISLQAGQTVTNPRLIAILEQQGVDLVRTFVDRSAREHA